MGLYEDQKKVYDVEYKKMKEEGYAFHPFATWKDITVGFLILLALVGLAVFKGVHMDGPADPTATYLPRPEWYFMFLFQLLKYFPGPLAIFAVAIIPGIVAGALALLPFFDKNPYRSPKRRPVAMTLFTLGLAGIVGLTVLAYAEDAAHHAGQTAGGHSAPVAVAGGGAEAEAGAKVFASTCQMCHGPSGTQIPNVALFDKAFIEKRDVVSIVTNGKGGMPSFKGRLTDDEIKAVAAYVKGAAK